MYFLNTGSDAYIGESFPALDLCFEKNLLQRHFSSFTNKSFIIHFLLNILDQFEKVFKFLASSQCTDQIERFTMYFLQCLNGVNIVYDSDLQMSDNVQQLVVVLCSLYLV